MHNRLTTPLSVHWHGIELDSYFDCVGDFSGAGKRIAPMIAPKDSFVVRFTPPRAGTFMYHVHGESGEELASGLYAPLIVLESGATFDARTDRVFILADGGPGEGRPIFVNGTSTPDSTQMVVGTTYRLRFITISANETFMSTMSGPGGERVGAIPLPVPAYGRVALSRDGRRVSVVTKQFHGDIWLAKVARAR